MYYKRIKRRILSIIFALAALMLFSSCQSEEKKDDFMMINAEKANEMMQESEEYVLLDVRTKEEYDAGHIPGAILIPHDEISEKAEKEIENKKLPVFVYCRTGRRSKLAAAELASLGYESIYEFGGIMDWPYEIE